MAARWVLPLEALANPAGTIFGFAMVGLGSANVALSGLIAVPDRRPGFAAVGVSLIFPGAGACEVEGTMTVRMKNQRL